MPDAVVIGAGPNGLVAANLLADVLAPPTFEAMNANLRGGAINGGTSGMHQQLVFRPTPGTGRPETPVDGLYLASAAHPGGGVHGAPGANAARAALRRRGARAVLTRLQRGFAGRDRHGRRPAAGTTTVPDR